MTSNKAAITPDLEAAEDRGERISTDGTALVLGEGSRHRAELTDLALELAQRSSAAAQSLR
jgi:hypothetical protein